MPDARQQSDNRQPKRGLFLRRFARERTGVIAVEFALLAVPFLIFLFASFEVAMIFFSSSTLENAVQDAARQIRTGQVQKAGMGKDQFKSLICDKIAALLDCGELLVNVQTFQEFDDFSNTDPVDENGNLQVTEDFNPGTPGDPVLVVVYYTHRLLLPNLMQPMENLAGGKILLSAASAFRNEPF